MTEKLGRATRGGIGRRQFVKGAVAAGAFAATAVRAPAILAQSTAPVRIGLMLSFSRSFSALGTANLNGMNLYFDQIGWTAGGRKIEILKEDDDINPQVGLQKLRKLIESDKVDLTCGPQASNVAAAVMNYLREKQSFHLLSGAGASSLTRKKMPYMFRTSMSSWQHNHTMGEWVYDNLSKEAIATASDFSGGREGLEEFMVAFRNKGGKIVKEIYPPLGTNDFSPYMTDIAATKAPMSFSFYAGTDAVRFVQQYAEAGLKPTTTLTGSGFMLDSDTLPADGQAALGAYNVLHYADTLDNPENKAFVAAYREKYNDYPSCYAEYGYITAHCIAEILKATGGDTSNKDKMAEVMANLRFNAPRGPVRWDPEFHNVIHNIYIRQVAEVDGRITNKVVATIPDVRDPGVKDS